MTDCRMFYYDEPTHLDELLLATGNLRTFICEDQIIKLMREKYKNRPEYSCMKDDDLLWDFIIVNWAVEVK